MPPTDAVRAAHAPPLSHAEIRRIIFGLMMAMLLGALDQTIVATALPTIGRDLGDPRHLPWVVTAYLLSATGAVPIYGKLSDIHGRRVMLLIALSLFVGGSVLCALSPSMLALIAARFVQGMGGGGLLALAQTIVGDMLAPRERAGWQAYFATAFTTASLAGPVLGGFFAQHLSWTAIFWINVPLGIAAVLMTSRPLKRLPRHERPSRLDLLGAAALIAATSSLLLALSWAPGEFGWRSAGTLGLFAASALLLVGFVQRLRLAREPLIPLEIMRNRVVAFAVIAATLSVGLFLGLAVYAPILFESVHGLSATVSGIYMLPLTVGTVFGTLMSGRAMARFRHYKRLPIAAMPCAVLAALALAFGQALLPVWALSLVLSVISIALGTLLPISTVSIQNAVSLHQLGTATATANLCRQLGGAVAVAIFGAVLLGPDAHAAVGRSAPGAAASLDHAFAWVFAMVAVGAAGALLSMVLMEERPLNETIRGSAEGVAAGE